MAASEITTPAHPELVPARMVNEFTYCFRLAYMEWVQGEFADSADIVDSRFQQRRVDRPSGSLLVPEDTTEAAFADDSRIHARSVLLSDETLGAIARIDLVEADCARRNPAVLYCLHSRKGVAALKEDGPEAESHNHEEFPRPTGRGRIEVRCTLTPTRCISPVSMTERSWPH